MSDTGTSTGDFDEEQDGIAAEKSAAADTVFVQAAGGVPVIGTSDDGLPDTPGEDERPD